MNDPKVVPAGEVNLEGIVVQPDQLNESGQSTGDTKSTTSVDHADNMSYLSERGASLFFHTYSWTTSNGTLSDLESVIIPPEVTQLLSYTISGMLNQTSGKNVIKLAISKCRPDFIRTLLESNYGPEIASTGIYEATGLDRGDTIDLQAVVQYVPEFSKIKRLENRFIPVTDDPYLVLFCLPVESRGFLTGATREVVGNDAMIQRQESINLNGVLTLKNILEYAKKTGQVSRVREFVDAYMGR